MILSIMSLNINPFIIVTISIMTFSIMTLSIKTQHNDIHHNDVRHKGLFVTLSMKGSFVSKNDNQHK
jgi:hypothetical protein